MSNFNIRIYSKEAIGFGEGPYWDDEFNCLYQVDCLSKKIVKLYGDDTKCEVTQESYCMSSSDFSFLAAIFPIRPTAEEKLDTVPFCCIAENNLFYCSIKDRTTKEFSHNVVHVLKEHGHFNDGTVDSKGRLWVGQITDNPDLIGSENIHPLHTAQRFGGFLCSLEKGNLVKHTSGFTVTNGICFSPDERQIYVVDSFEDTIIQLEYDVNSGTPSSEKKIAFKLEHEKLRLHKLSILDGLTTDIKGNVWVAVYLGGVVFNIDIETGKILQKIKIEDVPLTTSLCFGGGNNCSLFVTSCSQTLPNWSHGVQVGLNGGHTFKVTNHKDNLFKGLPTHSYIQ